MAWPEPVDYILGPLGRTLEPELEDPCLVRGDRSLAKEGARESESSEAATLVVASWMGRWPTLAKCYAFADS